MMNRFIFLVILVTLFIPVEAQELPWSFNHDSSEYYFDQGWKYVMDEGNYSASEKAYRKLLEIDPDFLIGLSLLGRISVNLDEQLELLEKIQGSELPSDKPESNVLEVYTELHRLMIIRQTNPEKATEQAKKALNLSFEYLPEIIKEYPDEPYLLSEYIETIHYLNGPQAALDSILKHPLSKDVVFLHGYKAMLLAELGKKDEALQQSDSLFLLFPKGGVPKPYAVKAQVYSALNENELAKRFAEIGLQIDPKNVDLLRIVKK